MSKWHDYPAAVLQATPEQIAPALAAHYQTVPTDELAKAYAAVARGLAVCEEMPRGTLGAALRQHLNIIVAEQRCREEVANG